MDAAARKTNQDSLVFAQNIIKQEATALDQLASRLDARLIDAVERIEACRGAVLVSGMGKAGLIGQKISATLCSTGTRSFFLHPGEAIHGDLGRVVKEDLLVVFSMSGETEELTRLLPSLRQMSGGLIAITSRASSTLGKHSDVVIELGPMNEADINGLAPSTSTAAMLAVGDALALTLSHRRGFRAQDFVQFHPGGSLGRKLTPVAEVMREMGDCRIANDTQSVRETFVTLRRSGRRTGAVMIVDDAGLLVGIFTDSDLARLLEAGADESLNQSVADVMTGNPITVEQSALMPEALRLLADHQISELPVVDSQGKPKGLIDITDLVSWLPDSTESEGEPRLLKFPRPESEPSQRSEVTGDIDSPSENVR